MLKFKVSRLIYRNSVNKTYASLKGFLRKSSNYIDDTEIEIQRRRTAGWELGFNQSWYIGRAILDYNLAYGRGTGPKLEPTHERIQNSEIRNQYVSLLTTFRKETMGRQLAHFYR